MQDRIKSLVRIGVGVAVAGAVLFRPGAGEGVTPASKDTPKPSDKPETSAPFAEATRSSLLQKFVNIPSALAAEGLLPPYFTRCDVHEARANSPVNRDGVVNFGLKMTDRRDEPDTQMSKEVVMTHQAEWTSPDGQRQSATNVGIIKPGQSEAVGSWTTTTQGSIVGPNREVLQADAKADTSKTYDCRDGEDKPVKGQVTVEGATVATYWLDSDTGWNERTLINDGVVVGDGGPNRHVTDNDGKRHIFATPTSTSTPTPTYTPTPLPTETPTPAPQPVQIQR